MKYQNKKLEGEIVAKLFQNCTQPISSCVGSNHQTKSFISSIVFAAVDKTYNVPGEFKRYPECKIEISTEITDKEELFSGVNNFFQSPGVISFHHKFITAVAVIYLLIWIIGTLMNISIIMMVKGFVSGSLKVYKEPLHAKNYGLN